MNDATVETTNEEYQSITTADCDEECLAIDLGEEFPENNLINVTSAVNFFEFSDLMEDGEDGAASMTEKSQLLNNTTATNAAMLTEEVVETHEHVSNSKPIDAIFKIVFCVFILIQSLPKMN